MGPAQSFSARTEDYLVDDILVSRLDHSPQSIRRTRRHLSSAGEVVSVQLYTRGSLTGIIDDATLALDQDHLGIVDLGQCFQAVASDVDVVWVNTPRERLNGAPRESSGGPLARIHRQSPRGRVLAAAIARLWSRLPHTHVRDAPNLSGEIVEVVESILAPGDFAPSDAALDAAIRCHIDSNLRDPNLTPSGLMRTFHCSRSTLYRLFEGSGGVAHYIRERRLQRCLEDLIDPGAQHRNIGEIPTRWRFDNPSHFNRLFKARFGHPPSLIKHPGEIVDSPPLDDHALAQVDRFHGWATGI